MSDLIAQSGSSCLTEPKLEFIHHLIYNPPDGESRTLISDFAPVVAQAARQGDRMAQKILRDAGRELALSAIAVAIRLHLYDQAFELALVGGVFGAGNLVIHALSNAVWQSPSRAENS